jgi:sialic acid synthase SpsE
VLTEGDLACMRPGDGLSPARLPELLGRRLTRDLGAEEPLTTDHLAGDAS